MLFMKVVNQVNCTRPIPGDEVGVGLWVRILLRGAQKVTSSVKRPICCKILEGGCLRLWNLLWDLIFLELPDIWALVLLEGFQEHHKFRAGPVWTESRSFENDSRQGNKYWTQLNVAWDYAWHWCPVTDLLLGYMGYFELKWICQGRFIQWQQLFASTVACLTHLVECNLQIYGMVLDGWRRRKSLWFYAALLNPVSHSAFSHSLSFLLPLLN